MCKQFASLVNDPMLATDVCPVRSVSLAELEAFAGWMAAHGGHMRRLQLDTTALWAGVLIAVGDPDLRTNLTGMGRCLMPAFATAAGSLQQLQLTSRVLATALLGDLPVLRSVELNAGSMMGNGVLSVGLNFAGLTAVESLQLRCRNIDFMRGAQLPPNLTRLRLSRDTATQLPAQVSCHVGTCYMSLRNHNGLGAGHMLASHCGNCKRQQCDAPSKLISKLAAGAAGSHSAPPLPPFTRRSRSPGCRDWRSWSCPTATTLLTAWLSCPAWTAA